MPIPARPKRSTVSHFYKYSSAEYLDRLESIVLRHELYFPNARELNDPADAKPKLAKSSLSKIMNLLLDKFIDNNPGLTPQDYLRARNEIAYNAPRFGTEVLLRMMANCLNLELDTIRIYSLSKRYNNMSLWAKYANNHTGYCLEFANEGLFACTHEVIYDNVVTVDLTDPTQVNANFFFYKSNDWINEEEVRIVLPRNSQATISFDPKLLTRVILGKDMSESNRTKILDWAQRRSPILVVVFAKFDELEQKLIIK